MGNVNNVTSGKPAVGGAISVAPLGTTLPKTAQEALNESFKSLGYISEDGLSNSNSPENDTVQSWGGHTVLSSQTSKEDTFQFKLIEGLNVDVLKFVYGSDNVDGDLETGLTVKATSDEAEDLIVVIDMILKGGTLKRVLIEQGKITEIGDIVYTDSDAVGYEITLMAYPIEGTTHTEFIFKGGVETQQSEVNDDGE